MNNFSFKKILILKLFLVFIAVIILTYSLLIVVKYQVFKPPENKNDIISLQNLAKKGSSDTSPDESSSEEKNEEKTPANLDSQKNNDETSQSNSKQEENAKETKKADPVEPPVEIYAVQPIIFLASDTNLNQANYQSQVMVSFEVVQDWYQSQLGKTFNLIPAITYRSSLTEAQLIAKYPSGGGMWYDGLGAAATANNLELCSDHQFYYFVTPLDNVWGGWVGAENLGCSHVIPGTASIPNHMGRLIGGIIDPDWPEWWADEIREAQGGVAHEIGHGLGASCVESVCNGLPHATPGHNSIMYEWWTFGTTGIFLDSEKTQILKSPFIN